LGQEDRRRHLLRRLSRTRVVQRLKKIDLSVVPIWLSPNVSTASRYQYCLGVGSLSLLISDGSEHDRLLLTAAATLHDVGSGSIDRLDLRGALRKKEYKIILDRKYQSLRGEAQKLSDPTNLSQIEDELCKEAGIEDWAVGLTVDQPLIGEVTDHWRIYLVVREGSEKPLTALEDMLSTSEPFAQTL
jgi:hypothetical protein